MGEKVKGSGRDLFFFMFYFQGTALLPVVNAGQIGYHIPPFKLSCQGTTETERPSSIQRDCQCSKVV